ncbi:MAG: DnaA ATPase domain-containing protein, partial [Gemmatimonadota bacterium]
MLSAELTPPEVWSLILEESKKVLNPQTFRTWLEPTRAVGLSEDQLLITVKNQFAVDYIEGQYGTVLSNIVDTLFENELEIAFQSDDSDPGATATLERPEARPGRPAPLQRTPSAPVNLGTPLNPKYTFTSFVVGNSNQWAHAASQAVADSPAQTYNPLFIYGGVGLGKTHLMQAIGQSILTKGKLDRVCYLSAETFMN